MKRPVFWAVCAGLVFPLTGAAAEKISPEQYDEGRKLAAELRELQPVDNEIAATLRIKTRKPKATVEIPTLYRVRSISNRWEMAFETRPTNNLPAEKLVVTHTVGSSNQYLFGQAPAGSGPVEKVDPIAPGERSFAGSDFWMSDLGLEFLHWPVQIRLKGEMRLGQPCYVLESRNPEAAEVVRIKTWIDKESGGILVAEFFDRKNSVVKEYSLSGSSFKKINGRYQLEKMEIESRKTGSQTVLKFNLPRD